jgi:hypothetical protein
MRITYAKCYAGGVERIHGPFPSMETATAYVLEHHQMLRWDFYYVTQDAEEPPKLHDYMCKACSAVTEAWDMPSKCASCGHEELQRMMPMPGLAGLETSASFLSGTKRKGFAELKEANKLETASFDMPPEKRGEVQKEIDKLRSLP